MRKIPFWLSFSHRAGPALDKFYVLSADYYYFSMMILFIVNSDFQKKWAVNLESQTVAQKLPMME
jgi:hypothetical protein